MRCSWIDTPSTFIRFSPSISSTTLSAPAAKSISDLPDWELARPPVMSVILWRMADMGRLSVSIGIGSPTGLNGRSQASSPASTEEARFLGLLAGGRGGVADRLELGARRPLGPLAAVGQGPAHIVPKGQVLHRPGEVPIGAPLVLGLVVAVGDIVIRRLLPGLAPAVDQIGARARIDHRHAALGEGEVVGPVVAARFRPRLGLDGAALRRCGLLQVVLDRRQTPAGVGDVTRVTVVRLVSV